MSKQQIKKILQNMKVNNETAIEVKNEIKINDEQQHADMKHLK